MLLISLHGQAVGINQTFWGLWLLPFGWLVVRSRFLPRWLGYWLLLDGIAWVVVGMTWFLSLRITLTLSSATSSHCFLLSLPPCSGC